ncbi:hypothetical protein [Flavobacterium sp.]|uniref:hypothetical protein n=1 Tax=Flavobacterium sp. TaxID=239 RepID=UPI0025F5E6C8|nr:hypothetical protein [Flavobacterium sp.]
MLGVVGFKQPYNPNYAIVDSENQLSTSGYFVTDNPYAKIEYIKDSQDYASISNSDFNLFLKDLKKSAISNVCNQVFNEFDFIDRTLLYKNASNKEELEVVKDAFVGYRIRVCKDNDVAFKINRVLLDFQGGGDITLFLWNTGKKSFIHSKLITITTDHQEVILDWEVDNSDSTYKGEYYLGYNTDTTFTTPFKRDWNAGNVLSQPTHLNIQPVTVLGHKTNLLFDLTKVEGMSESNGLNFDITVYDDYTDFVINNKMLFARAIQLDAIINCAQVYLSSLRSNSNQAHAAQLYEKIMIELEGTSAGSIVNVVGLKNQLLGEITTIRSEVQKMRMGFKKANQILVSTLM